MQRSLRAVALLFCVAGTAGTAAAQPSDDVAATVKAAPHVAVGRVTAVQAQFATNRFGDRLIVSRLTVATNQVLKGTVPAAFDLVVEGGTVGDLTLTVSDVPMLRAGDQAVFLPLGRRKGPQLRALRSRARTAPVGRGQRVKGTGVALDQIPPPLSSQTPSLTHPESLMYPKSRPLLRLVHHADAVPIPRSRLRPQRDMARTARSGST